MCLFGNGAMHINIAVNVPELAYFFFILETLDNVKKVTLF